MPPVGPELPPHLAAKRKRQDTDLELELISPRRRSTSSSDGAEKRRKVIGPSLPPANLDERPSTDPNSASNSDSEEDLGPALPPTPGSNRQTLESPPTQSHTDESLEATSGKDTKRDAWMLVPPKQDDLSSRFDPSKLRNRKFNTGKGAKAPSHTGQSDNALWTETAEQKRQRLEDEVMGVRKPAQLDQDTATKSRKSEAEAKETEKRIREYNEKNNRNTSLYSEHKKTTPKEKEDDPSKRAFDKEKDMGGGIKIGHAQKKELLNKAANFGSRFAGGNYL